VLFFWKFELRAWIFLERIFLKNFSHTKNIFWIFPKTIFPEIFPELSPKNFPAHAMNARFAIFLKMPHRIFREDSCIPSQPHAADPESKPLLALFFRLPIVTVSHSYRKKVDLIPARDDGDRPDIEILTPVTGILQPGNIHPAVRVSGLCKTGPDIDQVVTDRICYLIRRNRDFE